MTCERCGAPTSFRRCLNCASAAERELIIRRAIGELLRASGRGHGGQFAVSAEAPESKEMDEMADIATGIATKILEPTLQGIGEGVRDFSVRHPELAAVIAGGPLALPAVAAIEGVKRLVGDDVFQGGVRDASIWLFGDDRLSRLGDQPVGRANPTPVMDSAVMPTVARTGIAAQAGRVIADVQAQQARAMAEERARKARLAAQAAFQAKLPWVQTVLNKVERAGLAVDGFWGPRTRAAIQGFRARRGLPDEGVLGARTEAALVQAALRRLGARQVVETGVMDVATRTAISKFQGANGLARDGVVGPATRSAMIAALQRLG
jgi:peptidoglycan hydrolase-like protein with peptidoglycan-binding domain